LGGGSYKSAGGLKRGEGGGLRPIISIRTNGRVVPVEKKAETKKMERTLEWGADVQPKNRSPRHNEKVRGVEFPRDLGALGWVRE